ncbi:MAG: glutamate synthase large subunit [Dehalococcoidia bacterium]|nr:glutamate synthase large subunit [Dehalococcoidia bacterium]
MASQQSGAPGPQGLYHPRFEHDSCGVSFVVNVKGKRSNEIVRQGLQILVNLSHRGACGCEVNTGDGAGILMQKPHAFLRHAAAAEGIHLSLPEDYGVGLVFLPASSTDRKRCEEAFEEIVANEGQRVLGWRTVPTDNALLGQTAINSEPVIRHVFIGRGAKLADDMAFERKLYIIRKQAERLIRYSGHAYGRQFYIASLSQKTLVYKGMLMPGQLEAYFPDLSSPLMESALMLVHSRFSTNTFPSWDRAHPYRYVAHNGEINTLRGNVNWMHARQARFASELFGDDMHKVIPVIDEDGSDSAIFDNSLELLVLGGRSLPHAMMMMIPEPWENNPGMSDERRAFYEYHSCLMEPWDGPASIAFSDGVSVGAILDRNGLRPSRFYITKDDLVILASEVGVLNIPPDRVLQKGRLQPGRMILVDTKLGRIIANDEIKDKIASEHPYRLWLDEHALDLDHMPNTGKAPAAEPLPLLQREIAFGYTFEDLKMILAPMARDGNQPTGSMGTDTPLAVLSNKPQLLYNYFKELFAQVTNPPIDSIREEVVTSSIMRLGSEGNLLDPKSINARTIKLKQPILTTEELERLRNVREPGFKAVTLPILFEAAQGAKGLEQAVDQLCAAASKAIDSGANLIILSDRGVTAKLAPIPALLATAGLHHHLLRAGTRTRCSLIVESAEPREVHHFALLIGYGASAVCPYLAYEAIADMVKTGLLTDIDAKAAEKNYVKAISKSIVKTMAKMGISTIQSYRGAQIFEAIGLNHAVIDKYFTWTASQIEGIGLDGIAAEAIMRHHQALSERQSTPTLQTGGQYQWRQDGEEHLFNPETIHKLQLSTRTKNYQVFKEYSRAVNDQNERWFTLRGLFNFKSTPVPVLIEEVEPVENIVKRFKTGAMSYGSISKEAHEALAIAMNRIGGRSNTGEGGEDPERYKLEPNGDSKNSSIKQVASGRFGVTSLYLTQAKELQIKMAQGAKPGEGGELPGNKIYPWIAKTRHSTPGVGLISPPPHHDIYSIEDLAELIYDLKNANENARISVKLVSEVGVGTVAAGVVKAKADVILVSGHDGGTGASPLSSIKHAGTPWELGLAETQQTLVLNNLRSRVYVETDGQLKTGRDVVVACLLGAEEFGFATAPLVTLGCIMMRVCHLNTCPVGVATQDPVLRAKFDGDPQFVVQFMQFIAQEVRELMAALGFRTINEMVGRSDMLEMGKAIQHYKARGIDLSRILYQPNVPEHVGRYRQMAQDHALEGSLDKRTLMKLCAPALDRGEPVRATMSINNTNRVVGTIVGSEITRRYGVVGLPEDTIRLHFKGSAGQSFGAFTPPGMTLVLEGDSNDYIGKGLSGGKIIVFPPAGSPFVPEDNIAIGNVAFYGATAGEAYVHGMAGERFCVRNSGVHAVVDAVGDHGCEYMTGGCVVILGSTGRNFAAGMSGGVAYILDQDGTFPQRVNTQMVDLEHLEDDDEIKQVRSMVERHAVYTGSERAKNILKRWDEMLPHFVKVMPKDYKRMLNAIRRNSLQDMTVDQAVMAAFEENAHDVARVGGL